MRKLESMKQQVPTLTARPAAVSEPYAHRQYRSLFPGASDTVREREFAFWRESGLAPIDVINDLTEQWRRLEADLARWAGTQWRRSRISEQIRKAWQQVTQFDTEQGIPMLDLKDRDLTDRDFADFPLLEASFDNVRCLELDGNDLTQMPLIVEGAQLEFLDLRRNRIVLDQAGQNWLASCANLDMLALAGNPLGRAPDLTALTRLRTVKLAGCDLQRLPDGLAQWHSLRQPGSRALFRALADQSQSVTFRVAGQTLRRRIDEVLIWLEGSPAARMEIYALKTPTFIEVEQRMRIARVFADVPQAQQSVRLLQRVTGFVRLP